MAGPYLADRLGVVRTITIGSLCRMGMAFSVLITLADMAVAQRSTNWIEEIVHQLSLELTPTTARLYSSELYGVRQSLERKDIAQIQHRMARLITMLGAKEGGLSTETARELLMVIASVTPREYLDDDTHLRLLHIKEFYVSEHVSEASDSIGAPAQDAAAEEFLHLDIGQRASLLERRALETARSHPILALGVGMLVLLAAGASVFVWLPLIRKRQVLPGRRRAA